MEFDYKKILRAYIDHVGMCEGIDFLERYPSWPSIKGLTIEETKELIRVADEIEEKYARPSE